MRTGSGAKVARTGRQELAASPTDDCRQAAGILEPGSQARDRSELRSFLHQEGRYLRREPADSVPADQPCPWDLVLDRVAWRFTGHGLAVGTSSVFTRMMTRRIHEPCLGWMPAAPCGRDGEAGRSRACRTWYDQDQNGARGQRLCPTCHGNGTNQMQVMEDKQYPAEHCGCRLPG